MAISGISHFLSTTVMGYVEETPSQKERISEIVTNMFSIFIDESIKSDRSYLAYSTHITDEELNKRALTRHMTPKQKQALSSFSATYNANIINDFVWILQSGFQLPKLTTSQEFINFPKFALIAHIKRGDVTREQVGSLCLFYQATKQLIFERSIVEMLQKPNKRIAYKVTHIENNPEDYFPVIKTRSIFDPMHIIRQSFQLDVEDAKLMRAEFLDPSIPHSERYFHVIDLPIGPIYNWSPIVHRILTVFPQFLFHPISKSFNHTFLCEIKAMVVPSFTMIRMLLKIKLLDPMNITPLLGECTENTIAIYKIHHDTCIIQVGMDGIETPLEGDSYYAGTYGFSLHDIYHVMRNSLVKQKNRQAIYFIVDYVLKHLSTSSAKHIKEKLIDGQLYSENEYFGDIFTRKHIKWNPQCIQLVLLSMIKLQNFWRQKFDITSQDLLGYERGLYSQYQESITDYDILEANQELDIYLNEAQQRKTMPSNSI